MKIIQKVFPLFFISITSFILYSACGSDDEGPINPGTPGEFGLETSLVVVVNPIVNEGSSITTTPGTQRSSIPIQVGTSVFSATNTSGLAVITDIPVDSMVPVIFPTDTVFINVQQDKELYDYVVSYNNGNLEEMFPIVRYPIGGEVIILDSTQSIGSHINTDDAIIVLKPGTFTGNINITARNVLIFGSSSDDGEALSIIQGSVFISGEAARLRGLYITQNLSVNANNFEAAFCQLNGATIQGNNILLLRNIFTVGQADVSSSNSILLDNIGIP